MQSFFPTALRAAFTFVAFVALQYMIPYYLLVLGGLGAGAFMWKTGDDRALAFGLMIGSALFGVFAFFFGQV
jgi:hypothetical protein